MNVCNKMEVSIVKAHFHLHILKTSKWFPISIQISNVFIFDNMVVMCSFKINSRLVTLWINVREHAHCTKTNVSFLKIFTLIFKDLWERGIHIISPWMCLQVELFNVHYFRNLLLFIVWKSQIVKAHFHLHILKTSKWLPISIQISNVFIFDNMVVMCSFKINSNVCSYFLICVCLRIVVSNTYCAVFLLCLFFALCTLCYQFLLIVHFWLPHQYSLMFI
jgi:hypothetical protein